MRTYNPDTERRVRAPLERSENGRHFWVTDENGEKIMVDNAEVADYAFDIDGVRSGQLDAIRDYREKMRALTGRTLTFIVQETDEQPGIWKITDIVDVVQSFDHNLSPRISIGPDPEVQKERREVEQRALSHPNFSNGLAFRIYDLANGTELSEWSRMKDEAVDETQDDKCFIYRILWFNKAKASL